MRIRLQPLPLSDAKRAATDAETYLAAVANKDAISAYVRDVAEGQRALYERTGAAPPWIGYLAHDAESGEVLGSCSFVVSADSSAAEIAYFTFPPYERRGIAGAMAQELVRIARESGGVKRLYAHTLREENASTRILERLGFAQTGEAIDADAGPVWRWDLALS